MNKLKLGVVPTRRNVFSREDAYRFKKLIIEKLKTYEEIEVVDIDWLNEEGLLYDSEDDTDVVIRFMKNAEVDAMFFPHVNFGTEHTVARVAQEINKPVLLWGPRDEDPLADGFRLRDTQCGLFATGKVLRRFRVPFTYVPNCVIGDEVFERGFRNFFAVANTVRAFRKLRILQISTRPADFWTMMCNEGELLERFGIKLNPVSMVDLELRFHKTFEVMSEELITEAEGIKKVVDCSKFADEAVLRIAALKITLKEMAKETKSSAIAIQCWHSLQKSLKIMPCLVNSLLTDEMIPVTCETDIHGAITAILAQEAAMQTTPIFFADLTVRHSKNDNSELLFHCGNFPVSLAAEGEKPELREHFLFDSKCVGTVEHKIKGGEMSILRFDGDNGEYKLLMGKARGVEGAYTRGTYVWIEVDNWVKWERKLVEGPYVHHCVGIHQDVIPVLYEALKYIPGVSADLVDMKEDDILDWLNGTI